MSKSRKIIALVSALALGACAHAPVEPAPVVQPAQALPTLAQSIEAIPRGIARAEGGPPLALAIEGAHLAVTTCAQLGAKVSVLITDSAAEPIVLISGDGASYRSQLIARTKVATSLRYRRPSLDVARAAETDAVLAAEAVANPDIGVFRGGGYPIYHAGQLVGAIAVSGAIGHTGLDERCAEAGLTILAAAGFQATP
jgi:uncharacterized protein GlcG (DUF336 family)